MSQQLELASICYLTLLTLWGRIWDMKQLVNFHARLNFLDFIIQVTLMLLTLKRMDLPLREHDLLRNNLQ